MTTNIDNTLEISLEHLVVLAFAPTCSRCKSRSTSDWRCRKTTHHTSTPTLC